MGIAHQRGLNAEITELVKKKVAGGDNWSLDEIEFIQQYTGDGGLGVKASETGSGILYEFYTPKEIASRMMQLAYNHGFVGGNVCEPAVGIGRFLQYLDPSNCYVDAYEYAGTDLATGKNKDTSFQICKATYPWVNVINAQFESVFYSGNSRVGHAAEYDLVIGNPPYGEFLGEYSGKRREKKDSVKFYGKTYDQYFIWAGIQLLNPGGLLVFIVPSTFLSNNKTYTKFKNDLYRQADLINAFRMPLSLFEFTGIGTDIVVFKKRG